MGEEGSDKPRGEMLSGEKDSSRYLRLLAIMHSCGTEDNKVQECLQAVDVQEVCVWDGSVRQGSPFLSALLVANIVIETLEQIFKARERLESSAPFGALIS